MATVLLEVALGEAGAGTILVEASPSDIGPDVALASDDGNRQLLKVTRTLTDCLDPIKQFVGAAFEKLTQSQHAPDELAIEFSLKLGGEAGFVLAKGSAESVLKLTATWRRPVSG